MGVPRREDQMASGNVLDGPRLEPVSGGAPRGLIVLLHGYGSDGNDLIQLGGEWQKMMPDMAFVSPHAPQRCAQSPSGYQWFDLTMRDPGEYWRGVNEAGPTLDAFLDAELERTGLPEDRMALVGFSQGTMMALHVGLRRKASCAGILGYSGALAGGEHLPGADCRPNRRSCCRTATRMMCMPFHMMFLAAQAISGCRSRGVLAHRPGHPARDRRARACMLGGQFLSDCLRRCLTLPSLMGPAATILAVRMAANRWPHIRPFHRHDISP
jgi:phospholipase/carboxylesterase